jgi:cytochrome bd-type quinol oxidase subunit 1
MKRAMFLTLVGFGALTVVSGIFLAVTFAADWAIELHVVGAVAFTTLTIGHIWNRRKAARRAA